MKEFIFILGGARSGKSRYAIELAKRTGKRVVFIATAIACDEEMEKRIKGHKAKRPAQWDLIEEGKDISSILLKIKDKYEVIIIDCITFLISNLLEDDLSDKEILMRIRELIRTILRSNLTIIVVSNEVGEGVVPANPLARRFRDLAGLVNQMFARKADKVIFMHAGIPVIIKQPITPICQK